AARLISPGCGHLQRPLGVLLSPHVRQVHRGRFITVTCGECLDPQTPGWDQARPRRDAASSIRNGARANNCCGNNVSELSTDPIPQMLTKPRELGLASCTAYPVLEDRQHLGPGVVQPPRPDAPLCKYLLGDRLKRCGRLGRAAREAVLPQPPDG